MPTGAAAAAASARLRLGMLVAVGVAVLVTTGCSSGSTPAARPAGSESTSGTTSTPPAGASSPASTPPSSPVPSVEAPPTAPRPVRGRTGQLAFARHVMDVWSYALRTNDARPIVALGTVRRPCGGCKPLARELARRRAQGWAVDFPGLDVRTTRVVKRGPAPLVRATVDIPESDSFNTDGSFRNTNPAHPGATFAVQMRFTGRRYQLVRFTVS